MNTEEARFLYFCKASGNRLTPPKGYPKKRSEFAVPERYALPIDKEHIHAAISYFSATHFKSPEEKKRAAARIRRAAKKHGIKLNEKDAVMSKDYGAEAIGVAASAGAGAVW